MVQLTNGWYGWPPGAPFDIIHVGASAAHIPRCLLEQLKVNMYDILILLCDHMESLGWWSHPYSHWSRRKTSSLDTGIACMFNTYIKLFCMTNYWMQVDKINDRASRVRYKDCKQISPTCSSADGVCSSTTAIGFPITTNPLSSLCTTAVCCIPAVQALVRGIEAECKGYSVKCDEAVCDEAAMESFHGFS